MMPMLKHYGVGTIPWGPIAAGRESCSFISSSFKPVYLGCNPVAATIIE